MDHPLTHCFMRCELLANEERYRHELALRYSYVLPEPRLLEVVRRHSPLVELGAGTGYWAYVLRLMDADVVAYDQAPIGSARQNRYHMNSRRWTDVMEGDIQAVLKHSDRALFLCWPPTFSALWDSVGLYRGDWSFTSATAGRGLQRLMVNAHPGKQN